MRNIIYDLINFGINAFSTNIWFSAKKDMDDDYNISLYNVFPLNEDNCIDFLKNTKEWLMLTETLRDFTEKLDNYDAFSDLTEEKIIQIIITFYDDLKEINNLKHQLYNMCKITWIVFMLENNVCKLRNGACSSNNCKSTIIY